MVESYIPEDCSSSANRLTSFGTGDVTYSHRPRSCSTRRTNSSCEISSARPFSRSASRRKTSSSETSTSTDSVSTSEAISRTRSVSFKAKACFSISTRLIGEIILNETTPRRVRFPSDVSLCLPWVGGTLAKLIRMSGKGFIFLGLFSESQITQAGFTKSAFLSHGGQKEGENSFPVPV